MNEPSIRQGTKYVLCTGSLGVGIQVRERSTMARTLCVYASIGSWETSCDSRT